ncbi:MAG: Phosphatidylinositol 4-kinase type 2-beta [Icmadophila ericetorum]|nr:Phosphatidylinositol 4-kinase type 2-beta [Icmadophila ericetorum]
MLWILCTLSIFFVSQVTAAACNHDNCLRALRATSPPTQYQSAVSFCSTFTAGSTPTTAIASVPTVFANPCSDSIARLSSACSCMPTPIPTSTACQSLIQNGDWNDGPDQSEVDIPYWTITTENMGNYVFYRVQDFGSGNVFWTKWENDNPPDPTYPVYINLAQGFERCAGVSYQLSIEYFLDGYYDPRYPGQLPITFQVSVGFGNGTTPVQTRTQVYPNQEGNIADQGPLLMLLDPLTVAPTPGTDGLSITFSDSFGGYMELYLDNITMIAVSS